MITKRWIGMTLLTLALTLFLVGCGGKSTPAPTAVPPTATQAPPTATPVPPTATPIPPTPTPEEKHELTVVQLNTYKDNVDNLFVTGMLKNNMEQSAESIELFLAISDSSGKVVYTDTRYALITALQPGEVSPFTFGVYDELTDIGDIEVTVDDYTTDTVERVNLDMQGSKMFFDSSGDVYVTGELVNNSDTSVDLEEIAAATFDKDGNIITADSSSDDVGYLDPGESGPFIVYMSGPGEGTDIIKEYKVYVNSVKGSEDTYDIEFVGDENFYRDEYDNFHLVGEVANHSNKILDIRLVAAVYDADGNVLDADTLDLPLSALEPEETCPYDFDFWNLINYDDDVAQMIDHYTVQWDPAWTWTSSSQVKLNATAEVSYDDSTATFEVHAENDSQYDLASAEAVVLFRDKNTGNVVATADDFSIDDIPAGSSVDFSIDVYLPADFDQNAVTYEVIVRGVTQ